MGSVLGFSKNMEEEPSTVETMPTMPTLEQTVSGSSASVDPGNDLAYLQEQLLRDKWLKLMSYAQKKKKKKKDKDKKEKEKEKEKNPLPPKKLTPKKVSPKKTSPKKVSPVKQGCSLDQSPSSSACPLLLQALTSPEKKSEETVVKDKPVGTLSVDNTLAAANKKTVLSVKKKPAAVKTYSKTEKKLSGWLPRDADYNIFTSGSEEEDSDDKTDAFSTATTSCTVIPSLSKATSFLQSGSLKNSSSTAVTTSTAKSNCLSKSSLSASATTTAFKSSCLLKTSSTTAATTTASKNSSSIANEYEFSDNDESPILNGPFTKKFSEFKSQKLKSILEKGPPSLPTNGHFNSGKNGMPKNLPSTQNIKDSKEKVVKNLFSEKPPLQKDICSSIKNTETNGIKSKKPLSRQESVSSISSNDSVILKGSNSSSSSTSPCSGLKNSRAGSDSECSAKNSVSKPVQNESDLRVDEMEAEMDPVCSAKVVAKNNSSSVIEDEILGDGESRGGKTPEVEDQKIEEKTSILPATSNSIKYKSNRYYKPEQSAILWEFYLQNQYPTKSEQAELAKKVGGIEVRRIVWWFTHRRRTDKNKTTLVAPDLTKRKEAKVNKPEEVGVAVQHDLVADVSLACLVTNTCSLCSFTDVRPKLLRHLRNKHQLDPSICRRCKKIWQKKFFEEHSCQNKKSPKNLKVVEPPSVGAPPVLSAVDSLACLVTNACSVCAFNGVRTKLIGHLKKKHSLDPVVCRRCKKIWQKQYFEEHPCSNKKSPRRKTLSEKDISPEKKTVNNDDDDGSLHRKPLEEEVKATVEQTTPVKSECDSSMNVSSVNEESVLLLQTPQKAEKCTDNNDKDDDVEMKCEIDSTLMPCGSGTKCRTCPYDGPNILRHFQAIHGWQAKKCRKCTHFWEKKSFEEHPCSGKVYDFTSDNVVCVPQKKVAVAAKKVVVDPDGVEDTDQDDDDELDQEELAPVFKTPTKRDLQAPTQFHSRRYSDLLSQFSPKKLSKDCPSLSEIMRSSRFHRNGKLDLNYITPKQLEAVQDFMLGDISNRVRLTA